MSFSLFQTVLFLIKKMTLSHKPTVADPGFANRGGKVESRRREYRGAEGAEGGVVWGGVFLPHLGRGLKRWQCPLPRKFF